MLTGALQYMFNALSQSRGPFSVDGVLSIKCTWWQCWCLRRPWNNIYLHVSICCTYMIYIERLPCLERGVNPPAIRTRLSHASSCICCIFCLPLSNGLVSIWYHPLAAPQMEQITVENPSVAFILSPISSSLLQPLAKVQRAIRAT